MLSSMEASEKLLKEVCAVDKVVERVMIDEDVRAHVLNVMSEGFEYIVSDYPELADEIIKRIVNFHKVRTPDLSIACFSRLPNWHSMFLKDNTKEYWDTSSPHHNLRMDELITFFIIAEDHFNKEENKNA